MRRFAGLALHFESATTYQWLDASQMHFAQRKLLHCSCCRAICGVCLIGMKDRQTSVGDHQLAFGEYVDLSHVRSDADPHTLIAVGGSISEDTLICVCVVTRGFLTQRWR